MKRLLITILTLLFLSACSHKEKASTKSKSAEMYYTCSMHPQVHADHPGKCPICSMDLIPVINTQSHSKDEIQLTEDQIKLANIKFDTLKITTSNDQKILTGTVVADQKNNNIISSRISGRLNKLYFQNIGDFIPKGSKIYDLYSEELNTAKQEYILMLNKRKSIGNELVNFDELLNSAKIKLQLWGLTSNQISSLATSQISSTTTSFYSSVSGYIITRTVNQGDYISEGGTIYTLANNASVWVEGQVYTSQLSAFAINSKVMIQVPDLNNKEFMGKLEFIDPIIDPNSRIVSVRITLENHSGNLKPGMLAKIIIRKDLKNVLTVPSESVINSKGMELVWIKSTNNLFKFRMVTTGTENSGSIEIKSGLVPGDVIVTSGAYLLNSEYKSRNGSNPMAGMKM